MVTGDSYSVLVGTCAGLRLEHLLGAAVLVLQDLDDDSPRASLAPGGLEAPPLQAVQLT